MTTHEPISGTVCSEPTAPLPPSTTSQPLPEPLRRFIESCCWTFAKTYAQTWPHEYIVRDRVDKSLFVAFVRHIRTHGYLGRFYAKPITYFDEDGLVYWTMGAPVEETTVINRCRKEQTYEYRLGQGGAARRESSERWGNA